MFQDNGYYNITAITTLQLYNFYKLTIITSLQLLQCYNYYKITIITMLQLLQDYMVTNITRLQILQILQDCKHCKYYISSQLVVHAFIHY
jgi:hypothetical protein